MATAQRYLGQLQTIAIDSSGQANPTDITLTGGLSDTLEFTNLYRAAVGITFICADGPVFADIATIQPGKTSTQQSPQKSQITTNFNIVPVGGVAQGPYGIQVGIGTPANPAPMLIPITTGNPPSDLATISIPQGGWIQFDLDDEYTIAWTPSNVFGTPDPPNTIGPDLTQAYQAQVNNAVNSVSYTLTSASVDGVVGHGTVHINA